MPAFDIDAWVALSGALDLSAVAEPPGVELSLASVSGGQNVYGHH